MGNFLTDIWNTGLFRLALNKFKRDTEGKMKAILIKNGKRNSRIIKQINIKTKVKGTAVEISTTLPEYAKWVDAGRRPGKMPPQKPIIEWCKRKNIDSDMVFPIRKKIGDEGIKGTGFLKPLTDFKTLIEDLKKATIKEATELIKNELTKKEK